MRRIGSVTERMQHATWSGLVPLQVFHFFMSEEFFFAILASVRYFLSHGARSSCRLSGQRVRRLTTWNNALHDQQGDR